MSFSVIIPVLNEAARLPILLQHLAVYGKGYIAEIIVADGGSTDGSTSIATAHGARVLHTSAGRAIQMNAAARIAQGNILYFVHADTLPPANFATAILHALQTGTQMGCFRYQFDTPSFMLRINAWFTRFDWLFCQGGDKTFFIPKSLFEEMKGYDERFVVMEEYDFLRRAAQANLKLTVLPELAQVSARKYEGRSWLKVQIANLVVFNLWNWGIAPPESLRSLYKKLLT